MHSVPNPPALACLPCRSLTDKDTCGLRNLEIAKRTRSRVIPADKSALPFARFFA
jgi:hypothetical protein